MGKYYIKYEEVSGWDDSSTSFSHNIPSYRVMERKIFRKDRECFASECPGEAIKVLKILTTFGE